MAGPVRHARNEKDVLAVYDLMHETFCPNAPRRHVRPPFYFAYDVNDPDYQPEQHIFRRDRKGVASALKLFVRQLHHPSGPIKITLIGAVCTRKDCRGQGLAGPVIRESLDYSRRIRATAQFIVTPIKNYYLRYGYRYFPSIEYSGDLPDLPARLPRVEVLQSSDAAWMTEAYNAAADGYGPIVRSEDYMKNWILGLRLSRLNHVGLKLLRRGEPVAYLIADISQKEARVREAVSQRRNGRDLGLLAAHLRTLNKRRFVFFGRDAHPLVSHLDRRQKLQRRRIERFMYYPFSGSCPDPDETFMYSALDNV